MKLILVSLVFLCLSTPILAQKMIMPLPPEEVSFIDPMDIPLHLSGNFGEMRRYHFHTGLDIKTQQRVGIPVVAIADGYVSRIKIGPTGYGKAIYINHPSGYTSVYAHLHRIDDSLAAFVTDAQYDLHSFAVDLVIPEGKFPVVQGEEIAKSGNAGSSGGPHLHFEIRESMSERPVNPAPFGFSLSDNIPPRIYEIAMIRINEDGLGENPKYFGLNGSSGKGLRLAQKAAMTAPQAKVAFAIRTHDYLNGNSGRCGVREILLLEGTDTLHIRKIDRLDFNTWHQIQAQRMRAPLVQSKKHFQRSYVLPNMSLEMHDGNKRSGVLDLSGSKSRNLKYVVTDDFGNVSSLDFQVVLEETTPVLDGAYINGANRFDEESLLKADEASLYLPAYALYQDTRLSAKKRIEEGKAVYSFGSFEIPIQGLATLSIGEQAHAWTDKHYIAINDLLQKEWSALPTQLEDGVLKAETESLGEFVVLEDEQAPFLKAINVNNDMRGRKSFSLEVRDDESGLESIEAFLNEKWVVMDYDKKNDKITYFRDSKRFPKGKYVLKVVLTDKAGNTTQEAWDINW